MKKETFKIIPKPKPRVPSWVNILVVVSLALVVLAAAVFFLLKYQIAKLETQKKEIESQLTALDAEGLKDLEKELFNVSRKIKDFSLLFKEHKITSAIFGFLKTNAHRKVQFTSLDLSTKDGRIALGAKTENFRTLGEQLLILRTSKALKNLDVSGISLDKDGKVKFGLIFTLAEKFFTPSKNI